MNHNKTHPMVSQRRQSLADTFPGVYVTKNDIETNDEGQAEEY